VTLNSLVSAWLLQDEAQSMMMSTLLQKAGLIYDYLKVKPLVKTYMTVRPMQGLVKKHVTGLGFNV